MFMLTLFATLVAAYFAKEAYDGYRIGWGMFWALLLGWDLHTLLNYL
jgi:hypothetical protein